MHLIPWGLGTTRSLAYRSRAMLPDRNSITSSPIGCTDMTLYMDEPFEPGFRLTDGDQLNKVFAAPTWSADSAVSATGTNQATAYNIRGTVTNITAGVANTGLRLPPPKPGRVLVIWNLTATSERLYANDVLDTINGDPFLDITPGTGAILTCVSPISWTAQLALIASGDIVLD